MKINSEIIHEIKEYVLDLILSQSSENLCYHTVNHTHLVVKNAELIGRNEGLNENEMNILLASAWFHDTGYTKVYIGHEKESTAIATKFLSQKGIDENTISKVNECILATHFPHKPTSKTAQILCDADMMHLGQDSYFDLAENLRQELKAMGVKAMKKSEFELDSVAFFKAHTYFSAYCQKEIAAKKEENLQRIQQSIDKRKQKSEDEVLQSIKYSRGVDSMFKLTARNQISLSSIADNKSNILISLNGIIISLGLAALVGKFKEEPAIILPTVLFILFSLSTIILAILSTRPNISSGNFSKEDIKAGKVNMLFFGNFYKMSLDEYEWAIKEMINDDQYLYSTMTKDQYALGKVLAIKYKLLRWAYNIFMVGIVVSVLAFLLVFLNL